MNEIKSQHSSSRVFLICAQLQTTDYFSGPYSCLSACVSELCNQWYSILAKIARQPRPDAPTRYSDERFSEQPLNHRQMSKRPFDQRLNHVQGCIENLENQAQEQEKEEQLLDNQ
jgi:hypothetical protein